MAKKTITIQKVTIAEVKAAVKKSRQDKRKKYPRVSEQRQGLNRDAG